MKCARCEKEFIFEFQSLQQWLKSSKLDNRELSFLLYTYGAPLCEVCENDLHESFDVYGVNPNRRKFPKEGGVGNVY